MAKRRQGKLGKMWKEIAKKVFEKVTGWKYFYRVGAVVVLAIVIAIVIVGRGCGDSDSDLEKGIQKDQGEVILKDAESEVIANKVEESRKESDVRRESAKRAVKEVEKVRESKPSNTSFAEANRERCLAYPDSSECR